MIQAPELPGWAALLVAFLVLFGAATTFVGALGLIRLERFYERIHAPTLGTSWGTAGILLASVIVFSVGEARPVLHELLIGLFVTVTTPITLMTLGRAAYYRDRSELNPGAAPKGIPAYGMPRDDGEESAS